MSVAALTDREISQPIPLSSSATTAVGQIMSYYYNAIVDAKITQEFVRYFQTSGRSFETAGTTSQQRAEDLIALGGDDLDTDFLIGLAFTMYRTNGYGNYICAVRLQNTMKSAYKDLIDQVILEYVQKLEDTLEVEHDYREEKDGWMPFVGFWFENGMRTFKQADEFAQERFGHVEKIDKKPVVQACLAVQKMNSAHNLRVAEQFESGEQTTNPKVTLLREMAERFEEPQAFINSCIMTQKIQAHSDKTLVGLLKIRFPKTWLTLPKPRKMARAMVDVVPGPRQVARTMVKTPTMVARTMVKTPTKVAKKVVQTVPGPRQVARAVTNPKKTVQKVAARLSSE